MAATSWPTCSSGIGGGSTATAISGAWSSGIVSAMFVPEAGRDPCSATAINPLYTFPVIFGISVVGCLLGTFLGKPEDEAILKTLLQDRAPVGRWGPIREAGDARGLPASSPTATSAATCANVAGRHRLAAVPDGAAHLPRAAQVVVGRRHHRSARCSPRVFIKFNWYDKLEKRHGPASPPLTK